MYISVNQQIEVYICTKISSLNLLNNIVFVFFRSLSFATEIIVVYERLEEAYQPLVLCHLLQIYKLE